MELHPKAADVCRQLEHNEVFAEIKSQIERIGAEARAALSEAQLTSLMDVGFWRGRLAVAESFESIIRAGMQTINERYHAAEKQNME